MQWWESYADVLTRIEQKLDRVLGALKSVQTKEDKIMSALTDLQAVVSDLADAVTALTASVTSGVAEIETLLGKITASGTSDADVEAAVAQVRTIIDGIKSQAAAVDAEVAKAQA